MERIFDRLRKSIPLFIVGRGVEYFNEQKVKLIMFMKKGNKIEVESQVDGNYKNVYNVNITYFYEDGKLDNRIIYSCDCPNFEDKKKPCKHIIATGMAADAEIKARNIYFKENREFKREKEGKNSSNHIRIAEDEEYNEIFKEAEKFLREEKENIYEKIEEEEIKEFREKLEKLKKRIDKTKIPDSEKNEYKLALEIEQLSSTLSALRVKAGEKSLNYIKDLESFIYSVENEQFYEVTKKNIYNPDLNYFNETDKKVIKNLSNYFKKKNEFGMNFNNNNYYYGNPQGEMMNPMLAEQIFSAIENKKTIRSGSKTIYVTGEYEPIFAFQKDKFGKEKIILRDFVVLSSASRYFTLKNGVSNIEKFHKMSDAEWEIMNALTDGTRKGIEYLNEMSGKLFDEIKEVLSKYEIPIAKVTKKYGAVNIFVEEGNGKNKLQVTISCLEESIRTDDGYFIPKKNKKLQREISEDFQKYADAQIIDLEYRMYVGFRAKQLKSDDIVLVIDRNEFLTMADIIDEKYSEKVNINVSDKIKKIRKIGVDINIRSAENELFSVNFNIEGIDEDDVETVLESVRNEEKFVTLSSGELVKIANRSAEEMAGIVDVMSDLRVGENKISKIKALQLSQVSRSINEELNEIEEFKQLFQKIKKRENKEPSSIKVKLFPYQQIGFNWLKNMYDIGFGGILADDMGLGKTLQAISLISEIQLENEDLLGIIIVPTSLLHNWKEEFYKFSDIKPILVEGNAETRKELVKKTEKGILITTYQTFRNDVKNYKDKKFDVAILDEAQNIKNVSSLVKKATSKLESAVNFALTGTPIENSIMELWSIFDFILPGYLDNITKFRKKYKNSLNNPDSKKIFNLKNIVSPFILRRTKDEVLTELPEKVENNMIVELSKEQKKLYMAYVKRAKKELRKFDKEENNNLKVLAILTKLRQICNSPQLFDENYTGKVAKIELLKELMPDILSNGHRILIFSQFLGTLEEIKEELEKEKVEYFYIDGSVKSKERMEISKKFNSGEGQVVLISLKAGGTGLNLIGADVVIHYDPWWNFAVENQASDRAHRIGQKKSVQVIKLITEGTIEEKIIKIQENKRTLSENILGKNNGNNNKDSKEIFEMDEKELMELLNFEK
ncbi:DEAD/DEAH box helicase [Leptotrichia shahii]|uniref:DEAD/DEAH box helicase n=1 Tax=Leptotrichia shahii TaxID=157691 RepID=UPI0028D4217B|nr:DEAD/DEAH box helicase [Leptotrichia shahii]